MGTGKPNAKPIRHVYFRDGITTQWPNIGKIADRRPDAEASETPGLKQNEKDDTGHRPLSRLRKLRP